MDFSLLQAAFHVTTKTRAKPYTGALGGLFFLLYRGSVMYTLNSEPKALTGDKSEGIKSRGAAEAFIRGFSPVKAEGEEFNVLILSYTRELSRPFKENKG